MDCILKCFIIKEFSHNYLYIYYLLYIIRPIIEKIIKPAISIATTVHPTGVEKIIESVIPRPVHITEKIAEDITTGLKLLNTRIEETAGKTIKADVNKDPARFMARTIITAQTIDIAMLYAPTRIPDAAAKFSSKVTVNILS